MLSNADFTMSLYKTVFKSVSKMLAFKWFYQQITVLFYFLSLMKNVICVISKFNSLPIHNTVLKIKDPMQSFKFTHQTKNSQLNWKLIKFTSRYFKKNFKRQITGLK